jgi:hypothetical protein
MATAPTYTISCAAARKLASSMANSAATPNRLITRYNAAWNMLRVVTQNSADSKVMAANTMKTICVKVIAVTRNLFEFISKPVGRASPCATEQA